MEKTITLDLGLWSLEEIILNYYKSYFNDYSVKINTVKCYNSEEPAFFVKTKKILNSGFEVTLEDVLNIFNIELNKKGYNVDSYIWEGKIDDFRPTIKFTVSKLENNLVKTK